MNQEVKKAWVEALRSGKYEQGKGYLYKNGKHCCLGVLTQLGVEAGVVCKFTDDGEEFFGEGLENTYTPKEVQEWAGIDSSPAIMMPGRYHDHLVGLNDSGTSFQEIAQLIEDQL